MSTKDESKTVPQYDTKLPVVGSAVEIPDFVAEDQRTGIALQLWEWQHNC